MQAGNRMSERGMQCALQAGKEEPPVLIPHQRLHCSPQNGNSDACSLHLFKKNFAALWQAANQDTKLTFNMFRSLLIIVVLAALAAGGWYFFKGNTGDAPQYQTTAVTRGDLTQAVTATGQVNAVLNVQVGSQISGNIQKLVVDFNSPVKAGQVVAQLDPSIFQAVVHQGEADLANAKASLEFSQITARRQQELVRNKIGPQSDLDSASSELRKAEAVVKMKQANLEKAKVDLDHCTIYAPIDGVVISRNVDVGQTVAATMNAPVLFTIANDLRKMQINVNVAEADVGNVEVGQTVDFTVDAFPARTFRGKVTQVRNAPITVQNVVTYDTIVAVSNDELKLKPGMTANVSIIIAQREGVLKLPNGALRYRPADTQKTTAPARAGGQRGGKERDAAGGAPRNVYVLPSGSLEPKAAQVKLGISDGVFTEVLEGLRESELAVTGITSTQPSAGPAGAANPFTGGGRRY